MLLFIKGRKKMFSLYFIFTLCILFIHNIMNDLQCCQNYLIECNLNSKFSAEIRINRNRKNYVLV